MADFEFLIYRVKSSSKIWEIQALVIVTLSVGNEIFAQPLINGLLFEGEVSADELRAVEEVEQHFETFAAAFGAVKDCKTNPENKLKTWKSVSKLLSRFLVRSGAITTR